MGTVLRVCSAHRLLDRFPSSDHERVDAWAPSSSLLFSNPQLVLQLFEKCPISKRSMITKSTRESVWLSVL
jgi:activator of HSP90 ATPase